MKLYPIFLKKPQTFAKSSDPLEILEYNLEFCVLNFQPIGAETLSSFIFLD